MKLVFVQIFNFLITLVLSSYVMLQKGGCDVMTDS